MPSVAIDSAVREHAAEGRPVYRIHADRLAALAPNVIITTEPVPRLRGCVIDGAAIRKCFPEVHLARLRRCRVSQPRPSGSTLMT